ncbi:cilium assembly protein DZIP1L [Discoglossus pictus]
MPGYLASTQYPLPYAMMSPKGSIQTFRFQPRRDGIDWRRFSAIDVERVARELDVSTLQESINSITFCNLDAERCPYCQQPVDPVLLKVLKMAQLIIEYLLHCQDCLSSSMAQLEDRVEEAVVEHQKTKDELAKQGEELKKTKEESKRRKKLIGTQQMLLQAGVNNYHKCQLCDKAFMNYSYLQGHVQRRHPEITEFERQKKKQVEQMEDGIEELKAKLIKSQFQLEEEREMEQRRRKQAEEEAHHREDLMKRDFERWKDEERLKFQQEMDKMRQLLLAHESRFQDLETYKPRGSTLGIIDDEEERLMRQKMQQERQRLMDEMEQQESKWKIKLKEAKREHNAEKEWLLNENERLKASMSNDQRTTVQQSEREVQAHRSQIKDLNRLIKSYEQTIKSLTERKEVPQVQQEVIPVMSRQPSDSSEEGLDESLDQRLKHIQDFRMSSDFMRKFRPVLEETLIEKLESIGITRSAKGISLPTFKSLKKLMSTQLDEKIKKNPEIHTLRSKLSKEVTRRVKQWRKNEDQTQNNTSMLLAQSLKSTCSIPPSEQGTPRTRSVKIIEPRQTLPKVPVPSPRSKVTGIQNTSRITNVAPPPAQRTPPFTSEEDSSFPPSPAYKASQGQSMIQEQGEEDSDDWSDSDISPGKPSPRSVTFSTGNTTQGSIVQAMTRSLEKELSGPRQKPPGGVEIFSAQTSNAPNKPKPSLRTQLSYDSDSDISSLEEITESLGIKERKPQPAVRHSAESAGSQGTSLWSSGSAKAVGW